MIENPWPSKYPVAKILALYEDGYRIEIVAQKCGVRRSVVRSVVFRSKNPPTPSGKIRPQVRTEAQFWALVDRRGADECWPWKAALDSKGYGRLKKTMPDGSILYGAHASAVFYATGVRTSKKDDTSAIHSCDNPKCCNPAHLSVGTHQENMIDMHRKGRHPGRRKRDNHA